MSDLIQFLGTILAVIMTYFFTRSYYERKRRDDLADRDFNRRVTVYDRRIEEAREYVNAYEGLIQKLGNFEEGLLEDTYGAETLEIYSQRFLPIFKEFPILVGNASKKRASLFFLNDSDLTDLNTELDELILPESENTQSLIQRLRKSDTLDKENELARLSKFTKKANRVIARMKFRLDELAEKLP